MDPELRDEYARRLSHTDGDALVRAADGMDTAYQALWKARGRVAGVIADTLTTWDSGSGKSFRTHAGTVEEKLGEIGGQLSLIAPKLRAHGKLTNRVRDRIGTLIVEAYTNDSLLDSVQNSEMDRLLGEFHDSEEELKKDLWSYGALAPGGVPLPEAPPRPPKNWYEWVIGQDYPDSWTWLNGSGEPLGGLPLLTEEQRGLFDPDHPVYGFDEWGNLVPAWQAGMPEPYDSIKEAGIPIGPLLRLLGRAGKAGRGLKAAGALPSGARSISQSSDDLANLVKNSHGWRPEHINKHIREYYNLRPGAEVPKWMQDDFLKQVVESGVKQGKVFNWSLKGSTSGVRQPTYSVLRRNPDTGQWLVTQFYRTGERAGEFATAFQPTARQLARMLQEAAIK